MQREDSLTMRVMFIFTTIAVMGTWMIICFLSHPVALITIPKELITLILGFGGVKAFQRFAEGKEVVDTANTVNSGNVSP